MTHRSHRLHRLPATLALVFALSIPAVALAADGGTAGTGGSGGSGGTTPDPNCTVAAKAQAGESCSECQTSGGTDVACQDQLGSDFKYVCTRTAAVEVWCNGPSRSVTQSATCALGSSPAPLGGAALGALVAAAALAMRRRRG